MLPACGSAGRGAAGDSWLGTQYVGWLMLFWFWVNNLPFCSINIVEQAWGEGLEVLIMLASCPQGTYRFEVGGSWVTVGHREGGWAAPGNTPGRDGSSIFSIFFSSKLLYFIFPKENKGNSGLLYVSTNYSTWKSLLKHFNKSVTWLGKPLSNYYHTKFPLSKW